MKELKLDKAIIDDQLELQTGILDAMILEEKGEMEKAMKKHAELDRTSNDIWEKVRPHHTTNRTIFSVAKKQFLEVEDFSDADNSRADAICEKQIQEIRKLAKKVIEGTLPLKLAKATLRGE